MKTLEYLNLVSLYYKRFIRLYINFILDNKTRWSSTYNMLKDFLDLRKPIDTVISISESKAFKSKSLFISQNEYKYLEDCLSILKIFVLATKKL